MLIEIIKQVKCVEPSIIYWYKEMIFDYEKTNNPKHTIHSIIENDYNKYVESLKQLLSNCNFYFNDNQLIYLWLKQNGAIFNPQKVLCFSSLKKLESICSNSSDFLECMDIA